MWPYNDHSEDDYYKAIKYVENYATSLGAKSRNFIFELIKRGKKNENILR